MMKRQIPLPFLSLFILCAFLTGARQALAEDDALSAYNDPKKRAPKGVVLCTESREMAACSPVYKT